MFEQFLLAHLSGAHFHNFLSHAFLQFLQQHKLLINVFLVEGCTVEHLAVNTVTFRDTSDCECHTELFPCWDTFGSDACYPSHSPLCNTTARRNRWTQGFCESDRWSWSVVMVWRFHCFYVVVFIISEDCGDYYAEQNENKYKKRVHFLRHFFDLLRW